MSLQQILANIPLFKTLDKPDLDLISTHLQKETYRKGSIIFKEGDVGDKFYVVESGQLAVVGQEAGETIAFIGPGGFVGEISILLTKPRTATLQVVIDAQLWALSKEDFERLIWQRPTMAREMMQELGRRLVTTTRRKQPLSTRRITAVWGEGGMALAEAIQRQLNTSVGVLALPRSMVEPYQSDGIILLDNADLTEASLAEGLSYQIEVFKHIVLLLPQHSSPLAMRAVDLADTAVILGRDSAWPRSQEDRKDVWVFNQGQQASLNLDRVARHLTNRVVGLALSSGGSRGLAHVGVLKVLMEENIPIDIIAGTSGGALFGTLYAAGWDYKQISDYVTYLKTLTSLRNWDFNFSLRTGIVKGKRARDKFLARPLNHARFEDLDIPMFIVAADILTGEEIVFNSGPLADAIRASASVPILAQPWHYEGHFCSDGGIVNPLPANILRDNGADIVLASSVIRPVSESFSGPRDRMPNILQSVFNIFSAMEAEVVKKQLPAIDLLLQHRVSARSTLDFENADALLMAGEQLARQMLPEIKEAVMMPTV